MCTWQKKQTTFSLRATRCQWKQALLFCGWTLHQRIIWRILSREQKTNLQRLRKSESEQNIFPKRLKLKRPCGLLNWLRTWLRIGELTRPSAARGRWNGCLKWWSVSKVLIHSLTVNYFLYLKWTSESSLELFIPQTKARTHMRIKYGGNVAV